MLNHHMKHQSTRRIKMSKSTLDMSHQEWLEDRKRGIGGSDVASVLGFN